MELRLKSQVLEVDEHHAVSNGSRRRHVSTLRGCDLAQEDVANEDVSMLSSPVSFFTHGAEVNLHMRLNRVTRFAHVGLVSGVAASGDSDTAISPASGGKVSQKGT